MGIERGVGRGRKSVSKAASAKVVDEIAKPVSEKDSSPEADVTSPVKATGEVSPDPTATQKMQDAAPATIDTTELEAFEQIEYLLHQSTLGFHFLFDNADIARVLKKPLETEKFSTPENMKLVQALLSSLLGCPTLEEKRSFLDRLPASDFDLLVRAYFQLVDNTILSHVDLRH